MDLQCKGDGYCDVYEQVDHDEGYVPNGPDDWCGYRRRDGTEWCRCTREMCLPPCPNWFVCGNKEYPKWVLGVNCGRCRNCDVCIGRNLEKIENLNGWECPVCLECSEVAVIFPDCPSKHKFCIGCTQNLLWGQLTDDEELGSIYVNATKACPMCRHEFVPFDGWIKG